MKQVYLDNQSNTRVDERVLEEMLPFFKENYGNAQSIHFIGAVSKDAVDKARNQVAAFIECAEGEIYFASCGSESNNLAVKGVADAYKNKGKHIIVSSIEHFSVLNSVKRLCQQGFEVSYAPVENNGVLQIEELKKLIRKDTILVSIQLANTEIGAVQDIKAISRIVKDKNIIFHTDAVAAAGLLPIDVNELGVDLLTFSSSQIYGPKGAAALYVKKGVKITPQIDGGVQENGRRAGTENVPAIVGFGKACELGKAEMQESVAKMTRLRDRLISELPKRIEFIYLNGHPEKRLANNVNFSVEFIEGEGIFLLLDGKGICVSSGSACASKALKMSHVLTAINVDTAVGQGSILMSLSRYNTEDEIEYVLNEFPAVVKKLRDMSPLYSHFKKIGQRQKAGPGTDYEHEHEHDKCEIEEE
jgi:cysteine desulfurase